MHTLDEAKAQVLGHHTRWAKIFARQTRHGWPTFCVEMIRLDQGRRIFRAWREFAGPLMYRQLTPGTPHTYWTRFQDLRKGQFDY